MLRNITTVTKTALYKLTAINLQTQNANKKLTNCYIGTSTHYALCRVSDCDASYFRMTVKRNKDIKYLNNIIYLLNAAYFVIRFFHS